MLKHIQSVLGIITVVVMVSGCVHHVDIPETTKVTVQDSKFSTKRITTNPEIINELKTFLSTDCKWRRKNPLSLELSFQQTVFWSGDKQIIILHNDSDYIWNEKYRTKLPEGKRKTFYDIIQKMRFEPYFPPEETKNIEPMLKILVD